MQLSLAPLKMRRQMFTYKMELDKARSESQASFVKEEEGSLFGAAASWFVIISATIIITIIIFLKCLSCARLENEDA